MIRAFLAHLLATPPATPPPKSTDWFSSLKERWSGADTSAAASAEGSRDRAGSSADEAGAREHASANGKQSV